MSFGSSPSIENKFRNNTPYSSTVCAARVLTRQFATSLSYRGGGAESVRDFAKTPSTVFVLPTSRTRIITGIDPKSSLKGHGFQPRDDGDLRFTARPEAVPFKATLPRAHFNLTVPRYTIRIPSRVRPRRNPPGSTPPAPPSNPPFSSTATTPP